MPIRPGIIPINSQRAAGRKPVLPPQPTPPGGNPGNKWIRRSFVRMFVLGNGVWKVARWHRVNPSVVEAVLRDRLVETGALERDAA